MDNPFPHFRGALLAGILMAVVIGAISVVKAVTITPTVDGSVEDGYLGGPRDGIPDSVLGGASVQILNTNRPVGPYEDRGIIEFNISSLSTSAPLMLHLPVQGAMGPYPLSISVFTYSGDGALTLGDWNAGSLFTSFTYSGGSLVDLDITSFIQDLQSSGSVFAGFNFRITLPSSIPANGPFLAFGSLETAGYGSGYAPSASISDQPFTIPEFGSTFAGMVCSILVLAALGRRIKRS
jgi:hypothetical protein